MGIYAEVRQQLSHLIESGTYRAGDRLPSERQLSEALSVSRVAVREALKVLESAGRVSIRRGSGTFVVYPGKDPIAGALLMGRPVNADFLADLVELRAGLEIKIVQLAAERITPDGLARLRAVMSRNAEELPQSAELGSLNLLFEAELARIAGNKLLAAAQRAAHELWVEAWSRLSLTPDAKEVLHEEHLGILAALERRDAAAAVAAMSRHVDREIPRPARLNERQVERSILRAIELMRHDLSGPLAIDDLAGAAMFSKFHFSRVFHRMTGLSPGHFLSALRIHEARRLLISGTDSITEISHRVGYASVGSFSKRFAYSVGMPPTTYRQLGGVVPRLEPAAVAGDRTTGRVTGRVVSSLGEEPVFVGLFPDRIIEGRPVAFALLRGPGRFTLDGVPLGTWNLIGRSEASPAPGPTTPRTAVGAVRVDVNPGSTNTDLTLTATGPLDPPVLLALPNPHTPHHPLTP
ncbi:helix-turn-helix domain-containing protein [Actinocorallia sp. A-T 12471]|uniref:helix-turn-helix domain-containing protein n=1 Tax=Actinocorallia sp. A-T 12471 TaxID=3089813 RepID=UPI0029CE7B32|nr:FCD domain-containing protein [Actinocorallia sp. A-T 12471]MDX6741576.1 GntR family transcriptional regulator [Actinocorallia sp. A-T 12471]